MTPDKVEMDSAKLTTNPTPCQPLIPRRAEYNANTSRTVEGLQQPFV